MTETHKRIFGLDLLRCIAVMSVLIAHTIGFLGNGEFLVAIIDYTSVIGVELFFVLSGFLIGTILIKTHIKNKVTTFDSIKDFWVRRWFRTLPNYYLMLIIYGLIYTIKNHEFIFSTWDKIAYIFFLQNSVTEIKNEFFGVSWSLSVEEWFYLLFPLLLFFAQFLFRKKTISMGVVIGIFILIPLLVRILLACQLKQIEWDAGYRKMMPLRLDAIGIGVLSAYIKYYHDNLWDNHKKKLFGFGILLFSALMFIFYQNFIITYDQLNAVELADSGFFLKTIFFTLLSISLAMLLPFVYNMNVVSTKGFFYKAVNFISLVSYSVYLLHPVVLSFARQILKDQNGFVKFIFVWVFSLIGAYIQYRFFESKMTALRDKFSSKKGAITV